jgi:uncharacterized membrane protein
MRAAVSFIGRCIAAGLFFLIPLIVLLVLGRELLKLVHKILGPLAQRLPTAGLTGPAADYAIALVVLLLVAFVVGLLASYPPGSVVGAKMERIALGRIPGFTLFKSLFRHPGDEGSVQVLFVTLDDAWLFGFLMEELPDGMLAVFVPGVPSPTSGSLYFFTESQVKRTDISVRDAIRCLARLGIGATPLATGRFTQNG